MVTQAAPERRRAGVAGRARRIALANQKGGVGKTTTAINLGAALAERGQRILIVDMDPQANATLALTGEQDVSPGMTEVMTGRLKAADVLTSSLNVPGVDLLPANIALANAESILLTANGREFILRRALAPLADQYDLILVDTPPSLGVLSVNALVAASEVIVPVRPHLFTVAGLGQLMDTIEDLRFSVDHQELRLGGIVINQGSYLADGAPRARDYAANVEQLRAEHAGMLFSTVIPDAVVVETAHRHATSVVLYQPNSPLAAAYRRLAEEVIDRGG